MLFAFPMKGLSDLKPIEEAEITIIDTVGDVDRYMSWLGERRDWLAFDTETGGLEWWKQPLRLFQIGDQDTAWVFRADRWLGVLVETLTNYRGRIVGHNIPFDVRFYEKVSGEKFPWHNAHDSMVMAHILNPDKSKALKTVGAQFLGPQARKLQGALAGAMKKQGWGWDTIPLDFPIYTGYAGVDCILTSRVATKYWPQIEAEYQAVYDLEIQVSRICSEMEVRGVSIDLPYVHCKYEELTEFCNDTERWVMDNYRVLPSENQQVAAKLIEEGVNLHATTPSGLWSMDKDALEGIEHPLAQAVLQHRKASKIRSTYFGNFISMHESGVLHPSINTLGAETGRMSIQNPPLQTLPAGCFVRDGFIPRPGRVWVSADFDAIEMRLLAYFSQDRGMIEAIQEGDRTGGDIHTEMARIAYNDSNLDKKDPRRRTMKNGNFAKAYVAGVERFAWTCGISVADGQAFFDMYDQRFPGIKAFQKTVERVAKARLMGEGRGYVKSPLGRQTVAVKDKLYTLVNKLIQSSAADAYKQSLVDLDNAGYGPYMLLPVHDETDLELPADTAADMLVDIEKIMTQDDRGWTVPLTVSASGPFERWGEAYR